MQWICCNFNILAPPYGELAEIYDFGLRGSSFVTPLIRYRLTAVPPSPLGKVFLTSPLSFPWITGVIHIAELYFSTISTGFSTALGNFSVETSGNLSHLSTFFTDVCTTVEKVMHKEAPPMQYGRPAHANSCLQKTPQLFGKLWSFFIIRSHNRAFQISFPEDSGARSR